MFIEIFSTRGKKRIENSRICLKFLGKFNRLKIRWFEVF